MNENNEPYKEIQPFSQRDFPVNVFINDNKESPMKVKPHWHESIEILFLLKGKARQTINNQFFNLSKNDLLIISSGTIHGTIARNENLTEIIVIQFLPQLIEDNAYNIYESKFIIPFLKYTPHGYIFSTLNHKENIYKLIMEIYQEFINKKSAYELYIKGTIYQLISLLLRNNLFEIRDKNLESKLHKLKPLFKYIDKNYHKKINLKTAAQKINMSYYHFSRYFKEVTGRNFTEYINYIRTSEAKKYLLSKDMNISEIAYQVGYANVTSFNRAFKKFNGTTPGKFRNANFVKD